MSDIFTLSQIYCLILKIFGITMKIASVKLKIETNNIEAMYDNPINPIHKDVIERKIKMFGNQKLFYYPVLFPLFLT